MAARFKQAKIEQKVKMSAGEVVTPELKKKRSGPEPSKQNTNTLKTVIDDPNFIDQQMADAIIDTANQQTGSVKLHMDACNVQITLRDGKIWLTIVSNSGKSSQYSIIGRLEEESLDGKKPAHSRSGISLENAVTTSGDSFVIMLNEYYYDIANDKYRYTAEKQAILFQMNGNKLMTSATYLLRNQFFYNSKTGAYYYQASDWSVEKDTESPSSFYLNIANRQIGNGMAISDTPAGQKAVQNQANKPEDKLLNDNPSDAVKESSLKNRSIDDESKMPSLGVYGKNGTASGDIKQYGQADRDKEVTGEAQDPAKNGHPRPFDNFLEININSNDKLEGFMSALRNKEGKT
ncbi:MAG: hypothetical protein NT066_02935, partial [Candidatus Omnitrophica bacterium]|nr:hypothetical protein [Candidatus Omnitrophota bacterium]